MSFCGPTQAEDGRLPYHCPSSLHFHHQPPDPGLSPDLPATFCPSDQRNAGRGAAKTLSWEGGRAPTWRSPWWPRSLLGSPLAERAFAPRRASEISRPGLSGCRHAKADFLADPLQEPKLDGTFARSVEVIVVNLHGIRAFVESEQRMDHGLAAEGYSDLVLRGRSEPDSEHHLGKLLSVSDDFHCLPLVLQTAERWAFDEIKSDAFLRGWELLLHRCNAADYILRTRMGSPL